MLNLSSFYACNARSSIGFRRAALIAVLSYFVLALPSAAGTTGTTALFTPAGELAPTSFGDPISSNLVGGFNTFYSYFIEVPPGLTQLAVDIFDADVGTGLGEAAAGRDRQRGFGATASVIYTLLDPTGAVVATRTCNAPPACAALDNDWPSVDGPGCVLPIANPTSGHWELRIDMSSATPSAGDDVNAVGIRAYETSAASGDTELNIYYPTYTDFGVNTGTSRTYTVYPYITADCTGDSNDFDFDSTNPALLSPNTISYTSRSGAFSQSFTGTQLSANDVWANNNFSGWASDASAVDYGIWTSSLTVFSVGSQSGNYGMYYVGNTLAADPPPTTVPEANTFRIYLAQDGVNGNTVGGAPIKPYLEQQLTHTTGPNPPTVGNTSQFAVTIRVVNPTPFSILFDSLTTDPNVVNALVPTNGGTTTFNSFGAVSQGATASSGSGPWNLTWAPGSVAAGATAFVSYTISVAPAASGRTVITGTPSASGTTGSWVDETCAAAAPACTGTRLTQATFTAGPLCELAVSTFAATPVLVSSFTAAARDGAVVLGWETAAEAGTVGLDLYREERDELIKLNETPLVAMLDAPQGGRYRFVDRSASPRSSSHTYFMVETEANGSQRVHGPYTVTVDGESDEGSPLDGFERLAHPPTDGFLKRRAAAARERAAAAVARAPVKDRPQVLKIAVEEPGLYRLDARDIAALLDLSPRETVTAINRHDFRLTHRDADVAWRAVLGGSAIDFYAEGIDSAFTAQNIYRLRRGHGHAMGTRAIKPRPRRATDAPFRETLDLEKDVTPVVALPLDPEGDFWLWDFVIFGSGAHGSKDLTVDLPAVARTEGTARLVVRLQGGSQGSHAVAVSVNGTPVGTAAVSGLASATTGLFVPQDVLHSGANTIRVTSTGGNVVFVDGFDLTYRRQRRAVAGALVSSGDRDEVARVSGFPDAAIRVFDLSDPLQPQELVGVDVTGSTASPGQAATYQAIYEAEAGHPILAVSHAGIKQPAGLTVDVVSDLLAPSWSVDYLVITTADLRNAAETLAAYRADQGLSTLVVDLEDIYDELNYGIVDPRVIRDFLAHTQTTWAQAPRYVVLAGAGTYDYQDRLGYGDVLVPPRLLSRGDALFASDIPYVDLSGDDGIPEIAIGRIPAVSAAELTAYVEKVIAYESQAPPTWSDRVMLLSDNPDNVGDFTNESADLGSLLPGGFRFEAVALDQHPTLAAARQQLFAGLDTGAAVVSYLGHGGLDRLAAEGLLTNADVSNLSVGGGRLPLLTAVTCHVGFHALPGFDALGELLVMEPERGAIGVWAPGWASQHPDGKILGDRLFRELFHQGETTLGDAVRHAMASAAAAGTPKVLLQTYQLLGDPALRLWVVPAHSPGTGAGGEDGE